MLSGEEEQLSDVRERRLVARDIGPSRRFNLVRNKDISGVSGVGVVAWGILFPDGRVSIRWNSVRSSTNSYESLEDLVYIHGHEGATVVEWLDE